MNKSANAVQVAAQVTSEKESPKVVSIESPREKKVQSIITIGKLLRRRSQLSEELAVVNNLHFDETAKEKANIQISDSAKGFFENENPELVADLHEAAKASLSRQIESINSKIDAFSC